MEAVKEGNQDLTAPIKKSLVAKLAECMGEMGYVPKNGHNSFFNYDYAKESDILDAVREKLAARGVFVFTGVESIDSKDTGKKTRGGEPVNQVFVRTKHTFRDGESGEVMEVSGYGCGEDSGDKAVYKAITGAMKYFISKNFMISTGDDPEKDEDEKPAKPKTQAQKLGPFSKGVPAFPEPPPLPDAPPPEPSGKHAPMPQRDFSTFTDKIKSGSIRSTGQEGEKPWTPYEIETEGHGSFTTFHKSVYSAAHVAKQRDVEVTIHSQPGKKGPEIEEIILPPVEKMTAAA